jgi:hypothetical protein
MSPEFSSSRIKINRQKQPYGAAKTTDPADLFLLIIGRLFLYQLNST